MGTPEALTTMQHRIIRFEIAHPSDTSEKRELIRADLHLTPSDYAKALESALSEPAALIEYAAEVRRIDHRRELDEVRGSIRVRRRRRP